MSPAPRTVSGTQEAFNNYLLIDWSSALRDGAGHSATETGVRGQRSPRGKAASKGEQKLPGIQERGKGRACQVEGTAWPEAWRHEATCPLWSPRLSSPLVGNLSPDCFPRLPWRRDTVYVWELALMLSTERKDPKGKKLLMQKRKKLREQKMKH